MSRGFIHWGGEQATEYLGVLTTKLFDELGLSQGQIVDLRCERPDERYGQMLRHPRTEQVYWAPLDPKQFDCEFRAHLLLLGIP